MKTISRYIMTLALLITAVTGAWAEDLSETIRTTTQNKYTYTGEHFKIECGVCTGDGCWLGYVGNYRVTITPLADEKITKVEMVVGKVSGTIVSSTGTISGSNSVGSTLTLNDVDATTITLSRSGGGSYEYAALKSFTIYYEIPLASLNADNTEATFNMPAFDATADYELVRDMSIQMTATMGDGTNGVRYRVKKAQQGEGYEPADLNKTQVLALVAVNDDIEQKDLTLDQDYTVLIYPVDENRQILSGAEEGIPFENFTYAPGLYALKAFAKDDSDYAGETALSNTFKLFQGYEVEVAAKEFITYYKDEALYVEDEAAELYTIQSVNGDQAVLSDKSDAMPSNTPMLVYNKSNETKVILLIPCAEPDMALTVAPEFQGTLTGTTIAASTDAQTNYAFNGKQFVWVKDAIEVAANKCWLQIPSGEVTARNISIVFGDATGISHETYKSYETYDWYDLNGRKLNGMPTKKGVYIMNGRKVVVK